MHNNYTIQSFDIHLNSAHSLDKKTVSCLTLNWEFTTKLILTIYLTYHSSTYQMHKNITTQNKKNHHNTRYTWFTPSVGATSTELHLYSTLYKTTILICALSCRSSAHSTAKPFLQNPLRTQLQRSSMHSART